MFDSVCVTIDGLGVATGLSASADPPGNCSGQPFGRPPRLHEQAAVGPSALDPPPDVAARMDDHLTTGHDSAFQRHEKG
jgi:hypothetical protein